MLPAWLGHTVQPNLSEEAGSAGDRISVSFNFYPRRRDAAVPNPNRKELVRSDLDEGSGSETSMDRAIDDQ